MHDHDESKKPFLPTAAQIIAVLKAHRELGNESVLAEVALELGVAGNVLYAVPIETRTIETINKTEPLMGRRGRPPRMSFDSVVRAKSMLQNGFSRKEVAEVLCVSDRTLREYISMKGEFRNAAILRLQGESKCTKVRKVKQ